MYLNACSQFGAFWEALEPLRDGSDTRKLGNCGDVLESMLGLHPSPHSSLFPRCRQVKRFQFHKFYQNTLTCCRFIGSRVNYLCVKISCTMSQCEHFFIMSCLSQVYCHSYKNVSNNILVHTYAHCLDNLTYLCR